MKVLTGTAAASASERRDALVALCARQRDELAAEARELVLPWRPAYFRGRFGSNMKWPLMLAGGALGLFLTRPRRITRAVLATTALVRNVGAIVPLVRNLIGRGKPPARQA